MHPSRTPTAATRTRTRTGLVSLLTVCVTACIGAAASDLSVRGARPLPVALEFAALLAGSAALRLAWAARSAGAPASAPTPDAPIALPPTQAPTQTWRHHAPQGPKTHTRRPGAAASTAPSTPTATAPPPGPDPRPPWQLQPMPAPGPAAAVPPDDPHAGARRAFVNLARRIQAAVNRQLRELRELEARHGADPEVFGDLLQVDHATALIGRLADSLAVLGGDRPARRWQRPIPLVSVLRGAMSRITEYRRVEIAPLPERIGVDGGAVEALVHALAELLDNATRYSPPDTRVRLGARAAEGGCVVIEVVDAGVGLTPAAAERARAVLRTREFGLELASLGETPRLGLAVVGRLAQATGFEVSLHRADGGGVRAEIALPARLLRDLPATDLAPAKPEQRPHSHRAGEQQQQPPPTTPTNEPSTVVGTTAHGLPQRRRAVPNARRQAAENGTPGAQRTAAGSGAAAAPPGLWLTAFQAGLRGEQADGAGREEGRAQA